MLLIKSLNLNSKFFLTFFLAFSFCFSATGEEAIDIWNKKEDKTEEKILHKNNISQEKKIDLSEIESKEKKQDAPRPTSTCLDSGKLEKLIDFNFSEIQNGISFIFKKSKI